MSAADPVAVVAEALHWYARNPIADVSVSEVICAALRTAGLLDDAACRCIGPVCECEHRRERLLNGGSEPNQQNATAPNAPSKGASAASDGAS